MGDEKQHLIDVADTIAMLQKNFECPICLEIMTESRSTKCGHKFCGLCITKAIGRQSTIPCPVCKVPITKRSLQVLVHWNNIVNQVRQLSSAYEADTGIQYTPPTICAMPVDTNSSESPEKPVTAQKRKSSEMEDDFKNHQCAKKSNAAQQAEQAPKKARGRRKVSTEKENAPDLIDIIDMNPVVKLTAVPQPPVEITPKTRVRTWLQKIPDSVSPVAVTPVQMADDSADDSQLLSVSQSEEPALFSLIQGQGRKGRQKKKPLKEQKNEIVVKAHAGLKQQDVVAMETEHVELSKVENVKTVKRGKKKRFNAREDEIDSKSHYGIVFTLEDGSKQKETEKKTITLAENKVDINIEDPTETDTVAKQLNIAMEKEDTEQMETNNVEESKVAKKSQLEKKFFKTRDVNKEIDNVKGQSDDVDPFSFPFSPKEEKANKKSKQKKKNKQMEPLGVFQSPPKVTKKDDRSSVSSGSSVSKRAKKAKESVLEQTDADHSVQMSALIDKISDAEDHDLMLSQQFREMQVEEKKTQQVFAPNFSRKKSTWAANRQMRRDMMPKERKLKLKQVESKREIIHRKDLPEKDSNYTIEDTTSIQSASKTDTVEENLQSLPKKSPSPVATLIPESVLSDHSPFVPSQKPAKRKTFKLHGDTPIEPSQSLDFDNLLENVRAMGAEDSQDHSAHENAVSFHDNNDDIENNEAEDGCEAAEDGDDSHDDSSVLDEDNSNNMPANSEAEDGSERTDSKADLQATIDIVIERELSPVDNCPPSDPHLDSLPSLDDDEEVSTKKSVLDSEESASILKRKKEQKEIEADLLSSHEDPVPLSVELIDPPSDSPLTGLANSHSSSRNKSPKKRRSRIRRPAISSDSSDEDEVHDPCSELTSSSHPSHSDEILNSQQQRELEQDCSRIRDEIAALEDLLLEKPTTESGKIFNKIEELNRTMQQNSAKLAETDIKERFSDSDLFDDEGSDEEQTESPSGTKPFTPKPSVSPMRKLPFPPQPNWSITGSGLDKALQKPKVDQFVSKVQCTLTSKFTESTTHVIVKSSGHKIRCCQRTLKYFQGIAAKCWVVSVQWVLDSLHQNRLLPEHTYEICADTVEEIDHYGPQNARLSSLPLLPNHQVCLIGNYQNISKAEMKSMIENCGGEVVFRPEELDEDKVSLILIERAAHSRDRINQLKREHVPPIVIKEWLLDTIGTFDLKPLHNYYVK